MSLYGPIPWLGTGQSVGDSNEIPRLDTGQSVGDNNETAEALEIARESPEGAMDPTILNILESALHQLWSKVTSQPDSYVLTRDEFAVFNYFSHRFQGNKLAIAARTRYWDSCTTDNQPSDSVGRPKVKLEEIANSSAHDTKQKGNVTTNHIRLQGAHQYATATRNRTGLNADIREDYDRHDDSSVSPHYPNTELDISMATQLNSNDQRISEISRQATAGTPPSPNPEAVTCLRDDSNSTSLQETYSGGRVTASALGMIIGNLMTEVSSKGALTSIGRQRFMETSAQLLEHLHVEFRKEALVEDWHRVSDVLGSHKGRFRVIQEIVQILENATEGDKNEVLTIYGQGSPLQQVVESQDFLLRSHAFKIFQRDILSILIPSGLREILAGIPQRDIHFHLGPHSSNINDLKVWVETWSRVPWSWWPLEQPQRPLDPGKIRLEWRCTCGDRQWEDIPADYLRTIAAILARSSDIPTSLFPCRPKAESYWSFRRLKGIAVAAFTPNQSSAAASRYTPSQPASSVQTTGDTSGRGVSQQRQGPRVSGPGGEVSQRQRQAQRNQSNVVNASYFRYILFGISSSSLYYIPEQAKVNQGSHDSSVFLELRQAHESHQSFWRLWFSIWIVDHCSISKFSKLSRQMTEHEGQQLPDASAYTYTTDVAFNPLDQNPGFTRHMFHARYYACPPNCAPVWRILHACSVCPSKGKVIERLPKRDKGFKDDVEEDIWGVKPEYAVSWIRVMLYHFVIILVPLACSIWWSANHPEDTQTGPALLSVVLAAISAFWGMAGILTSRGGLTQST